VRKTDKDYRKLSKLLPEIVNRFPEHSDCGFFISCADFENKGGKGSRARLGKALLPLAPHPSRRVIGSPGQRSRGSQRDMLLRVPGGEEPRFERASRVRNLFVAANSGIP
jgi:hypothetical protein